MAAVSRSRRIAEFEVRWGYAMLRFFAGVIAFLVLAVEANAGVLLDAVKVGDLSAAGTAISQGADIDEKSGFLTPLIAAIRAANYEMTAMLLDRGADPEKGAGSNTPLLMAAGMNDATLVHLLLEKGADARHDANSVTALHRAAEAGCVKCVELLLAAGADVNALTAEGTPAIHLAKISGHEDIAALLLTHGYAPPRPVPVSPMLKNADASRGKAVFDKSCTKCHRISEKFLAPPLEGIVGRAKAKLPGQEYSVAIKAAGGTWTYEELNAFIANPAATFPGTAMGFSGITDNGERADVILYLRNQSPDPLPLP